MKRSFSSSETFDNKNQEKKITQEEENEAESQVESKNTWVSSYFGTNVTHKKQGIDIELPEADSETVMKQRQILHQKRKKRKRVVVDEGLLQKAEQRHYIDNALSHAKSLQFKKMFDEFQLAADAECPVGQCMLPLSPF